MKRTEVSWEERDKWGKWEKKSQTFRDKSTAIKFRDTVIVPQRNHNPGNTKDVKVNERDDK